MASLVPGDHDEFAEPSTVDLRDYARLIRRRRASILLLTVLGAALAVGYGLYTGPTYTAVANVDVQPLTLGPATSAVQVPLLESMGTQQAIAQSAPVIKRAAAILGVPEPKLQAETAKRLTVTLPTASTDLQFTWKAGTAAAAQAGANAFASAYLAYRHKLLANQIQVQFANAQLQLKTLTKQVSTVAAEMLRRPKGSPARDAFAVRLRTMTTGIASAQGKINTLPAYNTTGGQLTPAGRPISPSGFGKKILLVLGAILGLMIGLVVAVVRDMLDDRLHDSSRLVRSLGASTLAVLPPAVGQGGDHPRDAAKRPLAMIANPDGRVAEAVRELRTVLAAMTVRSDLRSLVVTAAEPGVSASRITAELAVALAESGQRVLLIAAHLRGSTIPIIFDVPDVEGLTDLLANGGEVMAYARKPRRSAGGAALPAAISSHLAVLPTGSRLAHSGVGIDPALMAELLRRQVSDFDIVLVEAPPVTTTADTMALAAAADGVVVVADQRTTGFAAEEARGRLDQVGAWLIGGVFLGSAGRPGDRRPPAPAGPSRRQAPAAAEPVQRHRQVGPPGTRPVPRIADAGRADDVLGSERAARQGS
jgi:Mrp family chromosome partitioning ATPase/capsular polysaccharide biosynthesis protein